eukprot:scaffold309_cov235-Pinguiococcus_pyrenoidosus.AAC.14
MNDASILLGVLRETALHDLRPLPRPRKKLLEACKASEVVSATASHHSIHTNTMFIHSLIHTNTMFIHSSIHSFIHSSIHPFIHSFIHPFTHSSIHPFIGKKKNAA